MVKKKLYFDRFELEIATKNRKKIKKIKKKCARILIISNLDGIVALHLATDYPYLDDQNNLLEDYQIAFDLEQKKQPKIEKTIKDYFNGSATALETLSINWNLIKGSDFQKMIWQKIIQVPFGSSKSYKQIGEEIQSKAYRAIGRACGANPMMLIIPCHRIVSASGKLAGFSSGLDLKQTLLSLEGIEIKQN